MKLRHFSLEYFACDVSKYEYFEHLLKIKKCINKKIQSGNFHVLLNVNQTTMVEFKCDNYDQNLCYDKNLSFSFNLPFFMQIQCKSPESVGTFFLTALAQ